MEHVHDKERHEHHVDIRRTDHEDPGVPPAYHARCECGWAAESHDEGFLNLLVDSHLVADGHEIPAPAVPSPD